MSMVWPCPLTVDAYASLGRAVRVPRPECPSCSSPVVFWSGYWRHVRRRERERKIFIPRVRCRACGVTHALLPAFVLVRRLDAAEPGRRGDRAGRGWRVRGPPGGGRGGGAVYDGAGLGPPVHSTGRGAGGELLGAGRRAGRGGGAAAAGSAAVGCRGGRRGVHGRGRAAGLGGAGTVAVRLRRDRREPAGRQRNLALPDHRQAAFHASQELMTRTGAMTPEGGVPGWMRRCGRRSRCTGGR